jgi:hypothetical protein
MLNPTSVQAYAAWRDLLKPREPNDLANYITSAHGNSFKFHNCRQKTNLANPF